MTSEERRSPRPGAPAPSAPAPATPEPAASERAASPSVIAFLFDRLSTNGRDNAWKAAQTYATRGHVEGDMVAVFNLDLALRTLQPFTSDLEAVKVAFDRARVQAQTPNASNREEERALNSDAERLEQLLGQMTAQDAAGSIAASNMAVQREFAIMQANVLRSFDRLERDQQGFASTNGLLALVNGLKAVPGRKTIVFFSEGLMISSQVLGEFRSVIATANRGNVTVYAVDVGGLRVFSGTQEARDELVARANDAHEPGGAWLHRRLHDDGPGAGRGHAEDEPAGGTRAARQGDRRLPGRRHQRHRQGLPADPGGHALLLPPLLRAERRLVRRALQDDLAEAGPAGARRCSPATATTP